MTTMQTMEIPEDVTEDEIRFSRSVKTAASIAGLKYEDLGVAMRPLKPVQKGEVSKRIEGKIKWSLREMFFLRKLFGASADDMMHGIAWIDRMDVDEVHARLAQLRNHTLPL